jgi:hypothetical protein
VTKSRKIFRQHEKEYEGYIKTQLEKFVESQVRSILTIYSLGYSRDIVLTYFDFDKAKRLACDIYQHLEQDVEKSIRVTWIQSRVLLEAKKLRLNALLDFKEVEKLTRECIKKDVWDELKPFVEKVVLDLFFNAFATFAKEMLPEWIGLASAREVVRPLKDLVNILPNTFEEQVYSQDFMFGTTPISEAMQRATMRLLDKVHNKKQKFLIIISDGEFPASEPNIYAYLLKQIGVTIVTCCISDRNIMTQLVSEKSHNWPDGAKTLYDIASTVESNGDLLAKLEQRGLQTSNNTKLFYQINQAEVLDKVIEAILGGPSDAS